jgi:hypothetical protein
MMIAFAPTSRAFTDRVGMASFKVQVLNLQGFFHHWLTSFPTDRVPPFIPISVQFLEYGVYGLDIVTFCLYVGVNAFGFWKDLFK